jgi:LysM repeat protein
MMNSKIGFKSFLFLTLLPLLVSPVLSQVVVERSKEKVIISGTPYYIHQVKKGETAYSISRAYNVTVEELTRENPPALYGVNEGQTLRIPVRELNTAVSMPGLTAPVKKDEARFIYHKLLPGETVYSLSKLYGVSENEIVTANPGIEINKLPVGSEIAVPKREFMTDKQQFAVQDPNYIFHRVVRGESISSIAEKYGISVRDLRRENRNLRFPQVGDYLRIPVKPVETVIVPELPDTVVVKEEEAMVMLDRPVVFTPVRDLSGSVDIAVLLPFFLDENNERTYIDSSKIVKGKRVPRVMKYADDWIYKGSVGFLEMYMGVLLAADTLRSLGLNVNLHEYDIKSDTIAITKLIRDGSLSQMDLIIGPVYSSNLAIVAEYAGMLKIPVVSPVSLYNNQILSGNPQIFIANSTLEVVQNAIAKKTSDYYDHNFVFIHSDTAGIDAGIDNFRDKIISELASRLPYEEIRFKEFIFYSRSTFNNDSINRLSHALSNKSGNVIIIASEERPVISETLIEIHGLIKKYDMKVFCYPSILGIDNLDPKFLFDLEVNLYSPYWIDYSQRDVIQFNSDFRRKFYTQPTEMSYAWEGYDIAYYFISGLAMHGKDFVEHPEIHNPDLLQMEFDFRRDSIRNGFENKRLFFIKYSKNYEVSQLPDTDPE